MLCQTCSAYNDDEREFCFRCQNKLLVLSGVNSFEEDDLEDYEEEEDLSLDEHLLERVSILEEALKRTAETLGKLVGAVQKQEKNLLVSQTGFATLRELLERQSLLGREEWGELWRTNMEQQLKALGVTLVEKVPGLLPDPKPAAAAKAS
jgi:predicted HicB family RNase H-like nuclease